MRISNLIMAASVAGLASAYPRSRDVIPGKQSIKKRASGLTWVGTSESGAEFGSNIPGTLNTDYIWPTTSKIQVLRDAGMNFFRIPFLMERLAPNGITGTLDATYLADLKSTVEFITDGGAHALIDPHNYGRYSGSIITSTSDFETFWKTVAAEFASNEKVIFDTNNEYHDMEQSLVLELNQAAIDGIRAAGATTQYIFVEGNAYSGAWSWSTTNDNLKDLTDPEDKIVYEMHQYLDSDSSGTSESCVSSTIGEERLESATEWLKTNGKQGFIGEFAGGVNSVCETAVEGMLAYLSENSDVWTGASWWSAGPWWGTYMYSIEPTDGPAYSTYLPILEKYFVDDSSSSTSTSTSTTSAAAVVKAATTTSAQETTVSSSSTSSTPASSTTSTTSTTAEVTTTPITKLQVSGSAPTEVKTSASTSVGTPSSLSAAFTSISTFVKATSTQPVACSTTTTSSSGLATHYNQCGGTNYSGPTTCESPYICKVQNPYYSQCVSASE
ncbi:hypothetical protein N7495_000124 [Penicillium taxi]|uniref:uncharacterized protein n=1 Tax=Penicillium taxi TaxID=168475 RepID=UPI002544F192|nr:uncharacterized protein N7495_000124 [Penicillium taxi]KAJ5907442.1 hypothetical protein N7495_000124 [Penicillium taxi]